jgi:hypothetical protein
MVCIIDYKTTTSYVWRTVIDRRFFSAYSSLHYYYHIWKLLVSLHVIMEIYRHSTGSQFNVIFK